MISLTTIPHTTKLYATDLMDFAYCKRLFYIQKIMQPPKTDTAMSVCGTVEHEVRRTTVKFLEPEYEACHNIGALKNLDYAKPIQDALDYALALGEKTYPEFIHDIELMLPELRLRLLAEEKQRYTQGLKLAGKGIKFANIIERILPWAIELGVGSSILGITGRIDQVYKRNKDLIPVDFKTHTKRFTSWIWRDAHAEQIATYALLLELQYDGYKVKNGLIKYTQDLYEFPVKFPNDNKRMIINHIEQARNLLNNGKIPPRLKGDEAIKCNHCHLKDFCFGINDSEENTK